MATAPEATLTDGERHRIILAVESAFAKLTNLYQEITPIIQKYGFAVPSAGVIARDLSERIEASIVQHCASFSEGEGHCDLSRGGHEWEVTICKDSGLTINQSKTIKGENYIVVNYKAYSRVTKIWVLWGAEDAFFSPKKSNTNARSLLLKTALSHVEILFVAAAKSAPALPAPGKAKVAKAQLPTVTKRNTE